MERSVKFSIDVNPHAIGRLRRRVRDLKMSWDVRWFKHRVLTDNDQGKYSCARKEFNGSLCLFVPRCTIIEGMVKLLLFRSIVKHDSEHFFTADPMKHYKV